MKREGKGSYYERLESRQTDRLSPNTRLLWTVACTRKVMHKLPFKHPAARLTALSLSRQKPATRTMLLTPLVQLTSVLEGRDLCIDDLPLVVGPLLMHSIFEAEWKHLSGRTRWNRCRSLWRIMWELYKIDCGWLLDGGRRFRRKVDTERRDVDILLLARLTAVGGTMVKAAVSEACSGDRRAAIRLRTGAHMCLVAELGARLSELVLPLFSQVDDNGEKMILLTDAEHSKNGDHGRDPLSPGTAEIIRQYVQHGRPLLLGQGVDGTERGLWITQDGRDAEACCMAAALRRATVGLAPGGVSANDIRRSALSQPGQSLSDKAQQARHAMGSVTAATDYAKRDREAALQMSMRLSKIEVADLPSASAPQPRPKARKAAARALKRSAEGKWRKSVM